MYSSRRSGFSVVRYTLRGMGHLHRDQLPNVVDPVIGFELGHLRQVTVAIAHAANLHTSTAACLHVRSRVPDHQAVFGTCSKDFQGAKNYVRLRFAREPIRPLHMIEMRKHTKL